MSITDRKITSWTTPVVAEADQPNRAAAELKAIFDANSNQLKTALNALIDDLVASGGAGQIGAEVLAGLDGDTVGEQLAALAVSKVSSAGIKGMRIGGDGYLEYTLNGTTWIKAPTWGDVTVEPGGDAKNLTVTFTEAETDENIASGETMTILFGKLMKWFNSRPIPSSAVDSTSATQFANSNAIKTINDKAVALAKVHEPLTTGGTAPDFTVSDSSVAAYAAGLTRTVVFHADGTAATLNFNGLGAKNVYTSTGKAANVKAGQYVVVQYDGTDFFTVSGGGIDLTPNNSIIAGDTYACKSYTNDIELTSGNTINYTTVRTNMINAGGVYRFTYELATMYGSANMYAALFVNGVIYDPSIFNRGYVDWLYYSSKTVDMYVPTGAIVELKIRDSSDAGMHQRNYTIKIASWTELNNVIAQMVPIFVS